MNLRIAQFFQGCTPSGKRLLGLLAVAPLLLPVCSAWSQTSATVTVNAASVIAPVPAEGYGVNAALWDTYVISSALPPTFRAGGISAVRFPGGSWSDCYHWAADTGTPAGPTGYPGCTLNPYPGANFTSFMNTDVNPAGAHAIVSVNYGSNIAGTGGGDPNEAAAWVQYANKTNGWGVKYWEIGNEIGGNGYFGDPGWEYDLHYPYNGNRAGQAALSPEAYATNSLAYISAMKAVDSSIQIGVGVWCPDTNNLNPRLFNILGSKIDFLIVHWYPGSSAISMEQSLPSYIAIIRNQIAAAGGNRNIPFAITETNADGSFAPALDAVWNADNYLTWFEQGAVNVDYWELYDSNGVLTSPTSPLDPYYAIQFASTVARAGDNLVTTSSSNSLLRSHAVMRTDGSVGVLLLNENSSSTNVSVSISGTTVATSGSVYTLNPTYDAAASSISGIGNSFSVTVPASSAIGILIPTSGGGGGCTATAITPYISVSGTWTQESSASVASTSTVVNIGPQPATGGTWAWTGPNGFTSTAREIDGIALSAGTNTYTATYTNTCGSKSTQVFTITAPGGTSCTPTAIVPYISVSGAWAEESSATVASTSTVVNIGPQPSTGGTWAWAGPNGYTSAAREIDGIPLTAGANVYTATYTNTSSCKSTQPFTITAPGSSTLIANGSYIVTAVNSGSALDDPASSTTNGTDMVIWAVNDGTNQQWKVTNLGNNVITLTNFASGEVLDVTGASKTSGALVDQYPANGQTNQEWNVISVAGGFELTSVNSGLALSVVGGGTANGTGIDQLAYSGATSQQWKFTAY
jgi:hypothetical protein